jgi:SNF2 family DNA or RNA helicase
VRHESDLKPFQLGGVEFLHRHPFAAYWLDLGLGKTVTALTAFARLKQEGRVRRGLISAPLRVATTNWPTEIGNWSHLAHLTHTVIRATDTHPRAIEARAVARSAARRLRLPSKEVARISAQAGKRAEEVVRLDLLREDTDLHIINHERIPWIVDHWRENWPYDVLIYDETQGLRDPSTQRVKALVALRRRDLLRRMWQMTGTPAPEGYEGLFSQIWLLDKGERFGRFVTHFRDRYFTRNEYNRSYLLKPGAADQIIDKIKDIALVIKAEDHLDLEKPVFVERKIDLGPDLMTKYKELENDLVLQTADAEIVAETAEAKAQKLLQFASGAVYDDSGRVHAVHDVKMDELRQVVEEAQGAPVIVAYWFRHTLARLKKAFPEGREIDKEGEVEKLWSKGKVPMLFLHPRSGGTGLNLQYGGHILVYFDTPWPLESYLQTNGRIARQGQTKVPTIVHLIAAGTAEERIVPKLRRKEAGQNYLKAEVQRLRAERLTT